MKLVKSIFVYLLIFISSQTILHSQSQNQIVWINKVDFEEDAKVVLEYSYSYSNGVHQFSFVADWDSRFFKNLYLSSSESQDGDFSPTLPLEINDGQRTTLSLRLSKGTKIKRIRFSPQYKEQGRLIAFNSKPIEISLNDEPDAGFKPVTNPVYENKIDADNKSKLTQEDIAKKIANISKQASTLIEKVNTKVEKSKGSKSAAGELKNLREDLLKLSSEIDNTKGMLKNITDQKDLSSLTNDINRLQSDIQVAIKNINIHVTDSKTGKYLAGLDSLKTAVNQNFESFLKLRIDISDLINLITGGQKYDKSLISTYTAAFEENKLALDNLIQVHNKKQEEFALKADKTSDSKYVKSLNQVITDQLQSAVSTKDDVEAKLKDLSRGGSSFMVIPVLGFIISIALVVYLMRRKILRQGRW